MNTNSLVGENLFLAKKRVLAGPFMNQSEKIQRVKRPKFRWRRSRRFGFSADGPKWAVSAVFRALGGQNGGVTFGHSPRRSDAAAEPGAPRPPFSHMIVGV